MNYWTYAAAVARDASQPEGFTLDGAYRDRRELLKLLDECRACIKGACPENIRDWCECCSGDEEDCPDSCYVRAAQVLLIKLGAP